MRSVVQIIGTNTEWLVVHESPKFRTIGYTDVFNYNYKTNLFWFNLVGPFAKFFLQHLFWNVKVEGLENVPKNTNVILMPNHISHIDSFFAIINMWPRKSFNAIADEKLFKSSFFRQFAKMFNAFPVRKGTKNLNIVKYALKRVGNGDNLLWYPEGQRHKNPSENRCNSGKLGSGMLAHATNVPIIPCFLAGMEFVMPVGKGINFGRRPRSLNVLVRYGKPVYLDDLRKLPSSVETSQKVVDRIMDSIEELRPPGAYRDQSHKI